MANGTALPIEQVHAGDLVMSRDAATGATAAKRVLSTSVRPVDNTLDVHVGGETIHTTRNHPFAVKGYGFVPAGQLAKSDRLQTAAGTLLAPQGFHAMIGGQSTIVYNFVVADWHTYFVGKNHIWVHNGSICFKGITFTTEEDYKGYLTWKIADKYDYPFFSLKFEDGIVTMRDAYRKDLPDSVRGAEIFEEMIRSLGDPNTIKVIHLDKIQRAEDIPMLKALAESVLKKLGRDPAGVQIIATLQ